MYISTCANLKGFTLQGHIIAIAPLGSEIRNISAWLVDWINSNKLNVEPTVYTCDSVELARKSLQLPLDIGNPPFLVIIDHSLKNQQVRKFAKELREGIPECWIIELVEDTDLIPIDKTAFMLKKPVDKNEWNEVLEHLFKQAATPQWSRAISNF